MQVLSVMLWAARATVAAEHLELFGDCLGEDALALSAFVASDIGGVKAEAAQIIKRSGSHAEQGRAELGQLEAIFDAPPDIAALTARMAIIAMMQGIAVPDITVEAVPKLDWLKKVAADFPPMPIKRWLVHGVNHKKNLSPFPRHALQIDATSAFGTGEHPTTRGCLILLDQLLKRHRPTQPLRRMLDMGCGTGILALAAAKAAPGKGHFRAVGVDLDATSVIIALDNARANGVAGHLRVVLGRGYSAALIKQRAPYDLIMANIFARPLAQMAKDARRALKPGGTLILAGLLNTQANMVIAAHRAQGLILSRRLVLGDWTILALRRAFGA